VWRIPRRKKGYHLVGDVNFAEAKQWRGRSPPSGRSRAMTSPCCCTTPCRRRAVGQSLDLFAAVSPEARDRSLRSRDGPARSWRLVSCRCGCAGKISVQSVADGTGTSRCATAAPRSAASCFRGQPSPARAAARWDAGVPLRAAHPLGGEGGVRLTVVDLLSTEAGGLWQLAFEKTKAALAKDGLLDPARKRPLPPYPLRIAVVTSPTARPCRTSSR